MLEPKKGRYQQIIRVDIAYLRDSKMIGFEEVITPDEIHGIPTPKKSRLTQIAPSYKIEHPAKYNSREFIVLL